MLVAPLEMSHAGYVISKFSEQVDPGNVRAAVRASTCHVRCASFPAALAVLRAAAAVRPAQELTDQIEAVKAEQASFEQVGNPWLLSALTLGRPLSNNM